MSERKFKVGDKIIYYPPIDETSTAQQIRFAGRNGTIKRISPTTHCIGVSADIEFKNYFGCDIPLTHLEHKIVPPVNFIDFTYDFFIFRFTFPNIEIIDSGRIVAKNNRYTE